MGIPYTIAVSAVYLAGGVFLFLLGLTILRAGRASAAGRATALLLFFAGLGPILSATSTILQSTLRDEVIVYGSMVENFEYLWEFYFPSLLLFSLTYPRENRILSGNVIIVGLLVFAPYIFHLMTIMSGSDLSKSVLDLSKSLHIDREISIGERTLPLAEMGNVLSIVLTTLISLHKQLFVLVNVVYAGIALLLVYRGMKRHINPRITGQLRTVIVGVAVSIAGYITAKFLPNASTSPLAANVSLGLTNLALMAGGGAVAYAVIKQEFLGIKFVARKSVLYGAAAILFALVYLAVVKPVSDFFGQYSMASKDALETGFVILTIIAFQPALLRIEEVLEGWLLKGRDDLQSKFKRLASEIAGASTEEELDNSLRAGLQMILDASATGLAFGDGDERYPYLAELLGKVGEPMMADELLRLGQRGRLAAGPAGEGIVVRSRPTKEGIEESIAIARRLVANDAVLVPIIREHAFVGYLGLGEKTHGGRYGSEELAQLSVISTQIGVAMDNIRLVRENVEKKVLEEELQIARRVQLQLLPASAPVIAGYDLSASTTPSRYVGGDYYSYELLDNDTLVLAVADVSGKGVPASLLVSTLHAAINSNADARTSPGEMMGRVNALMHRSTSPEEFATVFYGVVDLPSGEMTFANAGHEFPYLIGKNGVQQIGESGIVLGCMPDYAYEEQWCSIPRGGVLVLYTDGLTDAAARGGEVFGEERLRATVARPSDGGSDGLRERVLDEVLLFSKDGDYQDDLTLVVLKRG